MDPSLEFDEAFADLAEEKESVASVGALGRALEVLDLSDNSFLFEGHDLRRKTLATRLAMLLSSPRGPRKLRRLCIAGTGFGPDSLTALAAGLRSTAAVEALSAPLLGWTLEALDVSRNALLALAAGGASSAARLAFADAMEEVTAAMARGGLVADEVRAAAAARAVAAAPVGRPEGLSGLLVRRRSSAAVQTPDPFVPCWGLEAPGCAVSASGLPSDARFRLSGLAFGTFTLSPSMVRRRLHFRMVLAWFYELCVLAWLCEFRVSDLRLPSMARSCRRRCWTAAAEVSCPRTAQCSRACSRCTRRCETCGSTTTRTWVTSAWGAWSPVSARRRRWRAARCCAAAGPSEAAGRRCWPSRRPNPGSRCASGRLL